MPHPYPIREIARQAGLSEATVDRVLNRRAGVRQSTVDEVHRAIADLHRQRSQLRLTGRTFFLDLVVDAPARFSAAVRAALESQLPLVRPATFRARFHLAEAPPLAELVATLDGIARRGSQGVVLKAPDHPLIVAAVERLAEAGIPVVTLVTDLPTSRRVAYVGLDNRAAGATAAYLLDQWLPDDAAVLVTRGTGTFRGEDDREMGFRATMRALRPGRRQVDLIDPSGDDEVLRGLVRDALAAAPDIAAVYSMYATGGNAATVARLRRRRPGLPGVRRPRPGRREPRAAAGRAAVGGAAPRPGAGSAPRLPRGHAGARRAVRHAALLALGRPGRHPVQHPRRGPVRALTG